MINQSVSAFEKSHPGDTITVNYIENQSYKQKIQLAMGAGNPPTIFWTWGGGPLKQFIDAGDVASLGNPSWASSFLPSSLGAVTFDGKLYGVPIQGTQPVYFFYNKTIFSKLHLTFPTTFSGLLSTVATLKSHGYSPISLANGDQWPGLMYLEYLTDRIGDPGVFQAIELGKPNAWSNPAIVKALGDIQQLARAGAFQSGYDLLKFSGGGSDALVYSGKAATVGAGEVPVIKGATGLFAGQQLSTYDQTIYSSVEKAPSFQYSWDQAVAPQQATPMLANLAQVFELSMTPQKFAATMDSQPAGA